MAYKPRVSKEPSSLEEVLRKDGTSTRDLYFLKGIAPPEEVERYAAAVTAGDEATKHDIVARYLSKDGGQREAVHAVSLPADPVAAAKGILAAYGPGWVDRLVEVLRPAAPDRPVQVKQRITGGKPVRELILETLREGPALAGEVVAKTGRAQGSITAQLTYMVREGLLAKGGDGRYAVA